MPQSIIVYNNPLSYMLWEGGLILPIMVGVLVSLVTALVTDKLLRFLPRRTYHQHAGNIVGCAAIAAMIATIYFMV